MKRDAAALLYAEGDSFLHRRDPRVKIALFALLFVYLFTAPHWTWLAAAVIGGIAFALIAGTSWLWIGIFWAVHLPSFIVLIGIPLRSAFAGEAALAEAASGLGGELRLVLAWSAAIFVSISLFSTMKPDEVRRGLHGIGMPQVVAMAVAVSLRMIYAAIDEGRRIVENMRLKGVALDPRRPASFFSDVVAVSLPLVFGLLRGAAPLVYALDQRGYVDGTRQPPLDRADRWFLAIPTVVVLASIAVTLR